ncbi:MAG: hypothetical protein Q9218_002425 [Villophora microphyllina]
MHAETNGVHPSLLRELISGAHAVYDMLGLCQIPSLTMSNGIAGIWHWGSQRFWKKNSLPRQKPSSLHVVDVAAVGLVIATLLTLMIIVGDNWLHATTHSISLTTYDIITNSSQNHDDPRPAPQYQAGFSAIDEYCHNTLTAPLPSNRSSAPLPCSLNQTDDLTNIRNARFAYLTLGKGISQISSDFNGLDYSSTEDGEEKGTATPYQIVTYEHKGTNHSLFFFPDASEEFDLTDFGLGQGYGIDYVANTISMATECTYATEQCNISKIASGPFDINNISIPFQCYEGFSGNLGQTPATGHERAQGWNMSFYETVDGTPNNIPVQAQSNPFSFYAVTAVSSIDLQDFKDESTLAEGDPGNHSLVDVGHGFTGFALNCQATIYDVTFSLINGSFVDFNTTKASPQKASIIKAPLQVGFGQYQLFQSAFLSVLANSDAVSDTMSKSFSQVGMALASGVFDTDKNIQQRFRYRANVTRILKAPFWYLVVLCLLYSVFGMVMTVMAFYLRRMPEVREQQRRLMVEWAPEILYEKHSRDEPLFGDN